MKKRAQAAMEYLLVAGLITLVILPSIYIFYSYSQRSDKEIAQSQVNRFGTQIVNAAEKIYYLGGPSKTTLDLTMPKGVIGMEIWHNQELVFFLKDGSEIAFKSRVNITTDNLCTEQTERCHYNFKKTIYSPGLKRIVIKAKGDQVIIGEVDLTEVCNGLDDDYDDLVDEDFTNENCQPKCEYNGYIWVGNGGNLNCCGNNPNENNPYEESETLCYDNQDNDCDTLIDCYDGDCLGKICNTEGTKICIDGAYGIECTPITVSPSECSGYTTSPNCGADTRCDWCPECSGTKYSGDVSRCVDTGTCSYYCWKGRCGALCDETQGPTTQDYYEQSGTESPIGIEECDLRDYYCTADCGETYTDTFQYSCGTCKYISTSSCTGITLGSCTNYAAGTSCGTNLECDGNGNCLSTCVCSSGPCCDGCYYKTSGAQPTGFTDDTDGFCTGTEGATSTSYVYTRDYYCNSVDANEHHTDTLKDTCGTCEYCTDNDLTCNYYSSSTQCSSLQDCDYLNNYYITGTQDAASTSYCKYADYNDNYRYCNGAGSCSSLTCPLGSDTITATAGICQYISGCSGSTPGAVTNYATGTSCGTNKICIDGPYGIECTSI